MLIFEIHCLFIFNIYLVMQCLFTDVCTILTKLLLKYYVGLNFYIITLYCIIKLVSLKFKLVFILPNKYQYC